MKSAVAAVFLAAVVAMLVGPAVAPASSPSDEYVEHEPSAGGSVDFEGGGGDEGTSTGSGVEQPDAPATPAPTSAPTAPAAGEERGRGGGKTHRAGGRGKGSSRVPARDRRDRRAADRARVTIASGTGGEGLATAFTSLMGVGPGGVGPLLPLLCLGTLVAIVAGLRRAGRGDAPGTRE